MQTKGIVRCVLIAVAVVTFALPIKKAAAAGCDDIETKISAAKSAADHEAIAVCYDELAATAKAKSEEHGKMGEAYKKMGGAAVHKWNLPQHCTYFTKSFAAEAKSYAEMAAAHRKMAKAAQ